MKVPSPGESITEVEIAQWLVKDGDFVEKDQPIEAVIHFAGLKSVKESIIKPNHYWDVNVNGTITLLKVMQNLAKEIGQSLRLTSQMAAFLNCQLIIRLLPILIMSILIIIKIFRI